LDLRYSNEEICLTVKLLLPRSDKKYPKVCLDSEFGFRQGEMEEVVGVFISGLFTNLVKSIRRLIL